MQAVQQDSWKSRRKQKGRERFARDARRFSVILLVALLGVALLGFLFPPFFKPQTHLVLFGKGTIESTDLPPISFVTEDLAELAGVHYATVHDRRDEMKSAPTAVDALEALGDLH
ncbi:MAG: hypothetical protein AAFV88_24170, partial [Planctomycetota bacterium]